MISSVMPVYRRFDAAFERSEGACLFDESGVPDETCPAPETGA